MISEKEILISDIEQFFKEIILLKELSDVTKYGANFRVWEDFATELYNSFLGYKFTNVNNFSDNHAAIDIGDLENKLCIQVTKNLSSEKIKHTIKMFEKYELYNKYDKLIILLVELDKDIPKFKNVNFETNGKYNFSKENIIGLNNVTNQITNFNLSKLKDFLDLCIGYFPLIKLNTGKDFSRYNIKNKLILPTINTSKNLNKIRDKIVNDKDYVKGEQLIDEYLSNNSKDLDLAYNLKGVIYFNSSENYTEALKYFDKSIKQNNNFYKAIVNKIKTLYQIFIKSNRNEEYFDVLYKFIKENISKIEDNDLLTEVIDIYGSILIINGKSDIYDEWINIVNNLQKYSEFMYYGLFLIYSELSNIEYGKEILLNGLNNYPKSLKLNLSKIQLDLKELDKKVIRYNIDILPQLDDKQYNKLLKIINKYYSLLDLIENSGESSKEINRNKYQIYLLSYQLGLDNEKKYIELYYSINLNDVDKYLIWQYDLLRINKNLKVRKFEIAYNIINDSVVKEKIPFVEYVKLASIFLYHGGHKYCNEILKNLEDFTDFDKNSIEYWEYLIQSEVLLGNEENIQNYINKAKIIFEGTQHYKTILKITVSIIFRDIESQENISKLHSSLVELHKETGDSDDIKLVKIDESKDLLKQLEKQIPKIKLKEPVFDANNFYLTHSIPHYFLQKNGETYIELLTKRTPLLPIRIGFPDTKSNLELIDKDYNSGKYILSYESLFNLHELKLLEYYLLKDLLKNKNKEFDLYITRELLNLVRIDSLNKKDEIIKEIYNFILDSKINVIEDKGKVRDIFKGWKIKENDKTYKILPKWFINSISFAKKTGAVFITDDSSNLLTHNVYGIEVITSMAIIGKKLKNPLLNSINKSESIYNISKYNYTFISFTSVDLLYIYEKSVEDNRFIYIYEKYEINSSFFYLCHQIIVNYSCNLDSFFNVFIEFANKVSNKNKPRLRVYIVFFIYLFTDFFKRYLSHLMQVKNDKKIFDKLFNELEKYVDLNSYVVKILIGKLDEIELNNLLEDYEFLTTKDEEFNKGFGMYIPDTIKNLLTNIESGKQV